MFNVILLFINYLNQTIIKKLTTKISIVTITAFLLSCDSLKNRERPSEGAGSATQVTPNDSSGASSRKALGTAEGGQKDSIKNSANLSTPASDSTKKRPDK